MQLENVLLVDDDELFNHLHTRILFHTKLVGHVHAVLNGEKALAFLTDFYTTNQSLPDAILLDLDMPVMNGFEFMKALKNLDLPGADQIPIIIITSSNDPRDITKIKMMGITNYLIKPVPLEEMKNTLRSLH